MILTIMWKIIKIYLRNFVTRVAIKYWCKTKKIKKNERLIFIYRISLSMWLIKIVRINTTYTRDKKLVVRKR